MRILIRNVPSPSRGQRTFFAQPTINDVESNHRFVFVSEIDRRQGMASGMDSSFFRVAGLYSFP